MYSWTLKGAFLRKQILPGIPGKNTHGEIHGIEQPNGQGYP